MTAAPVSAGRVAVIVVAYNDPAVLARCLDSLAAGGYRDHGIFISDNSTTDAVERAFGGREGIWYARNPDNLGFCEANNVALAAAMRAGYAYALLLNHDTIVERECLGRLVAAAGSRNPPAIVTGKIRLLPDNGRLWYGGGYFSSLIGAGKNLGFNVPDRGQFDKAGEVTYATGCCMLVPMEAFRKAGPLNSRMFMYLDDIEFCLRAARADFRILYEPAAVIHHELGSGATLRQRPDYYLYFSIRNKPLVAPPGPYRAYLHLLALVFAAVKAAQFALLPGLPGRAGKLRALALGALDSLSGEERHRRRFPRLFRTRT